MKTQRPEITVVTPLYNEESCFTELYTRLSQSVQTLTDNYELLFVNDGSSDGTLVLLKDCVLKDPKVKFISFSRNFGHQNAITAGIAHAAGKSIAIIDGDLQDPPELIPKLYEKHCEGYHVVYAKRTVRKGETVLKRITAKVFYRLMKRITSIDIPLDTGDFRIISDKVAMHLKMMDEKNKFIRGQIAWLGFSQAAVEYTRESRFSGETKFTLRRMMRFAFDGITAFSNFPLQIATMLGFVFATVAFVIGLYALYSKLILNQVVSGWTSIVVSTMFIGGVQLLCIGIIGEYMSRIGTDVKKRPSYVIEETNVNAVTD